MSWRAEARHSRYCILFLRSLGFLMNAKAATNAVAAVPACWIPVTKIRRVSKRWRWCQKMRATLIACRVQIERDMKEWLSSAFRNASSPSPSSEFASSGSSYLAHGR